MANEGASLPLVPSQIQQPPTVVPTQQPDDAEQPMVPPIQSPMSTEKPEPVSSLNWPHFKPEFADKPDEGVEAHLLRTNDWMYIHAFQEGVKVQNFCLTLVGKARLWYESLRPIIVDWNGLQAQLRQQYSRIGNTREQVFHA